LRRAGAFFQAPSFAFFSRKASAGPCISWTWWGSAYAFTEERLHQELGPTLLATARAIAAEIGGSVPPPAP
jgi:DNA-binding IclR family transcriptional regulator